MKNKIPIIIVLVLVLLCLARFYIINKTIKSNQLMCLDGLNKVENGFDSTYYDANKHGIETELLYAIEGEKNWDKLSLTSKFKHKYKNSKVLFPEQDKYSILGCGSKIDLDGTKIIVIYGNNKPEFLDFLNQSPITTYYYYRYILSDDDKIDDIELVKKEVRNSITEEIITR